jgi:hypothetical protein
MPAQPVPRAEEGDDEDTPVPDRPPAPVIRIRLCPLCRGRGAMQIVPDRQRPQHVVLRPCIVCKGNGYVSAKSLTRPPRSSNTLRS